MSKLLKQAAVAVTAGVSTETPAPAVGSSSYYWMDESKIMDNPFQYRMFYDAEKLLELAENIVLLKADLSTLGLEQVPFARLVRVIEGHGDYAPIAREELSTPEQIAHWMAQPGVLAELMFGHRRRRAWTVVRYGVEEGCRRLGIALTDELRTRYQALRGDPDYASMPLSIGFATAPQMWKHVVSENRHRSDTTAIEEAESMATAKDAFRYTDGQIGEVFGYARSTVANKLRLLKLPDGVRKMLLDGELSERHGRELVRLAEYPVVVEELANEVVKRNLSPDMLTSNVNYRIENIEEEAKRQAQLSRAKQACMSWCLPGQSNPVGNVRIETKKPHWEVMAFESGADIGLLESGMCGGACECLGLKYHQHAASGAVRPDKEGAPNVLLVCSSRQRRANRLKEWEKVHAPTAKLNSKERERIELEQKRKQIKAEVDAQSQQMIDETLAGLNLRSMWNSVEFWRMVAKRNMPEQFYKRLEAAKSINDVADVYVRWLVDGHTMKEWKSEAGDYVHDLAKLRGSLRALQAVGGVSVETE